MKIPSFVLTLYRLPQTVFTAKEIAIILHERNLDSLKAKIDYYVRNGALIRLRRGIYAKENYNIFEVGVKIYTPSYISLETVLQRGGIIFQDYRDIFLISYLSRRIRCAGYGFVYKKIKDEVLLNTDGIVIESGYAIASNERAFLDAIYLYKEYHFDNLSVINWERAMELVKIYNNKNMAKLLNKHYLEVKNA